MTDYTDLIDPTIDFYAVLGLSETASAAEIKQAFRRLAVQHHPDKGGDVTTMQAINEAHDTIGDPEKRAVYDNLRSQYLADVSWHFKQGQRKRKTRRPRGGFFDNAGNMTLRQKVIDSLHIFINDMGIPLPPGVLNDWKLAVEFVFAVWREEKQRGNVGYVSFGGVRMPKRQITQGDNLYKE